MNFFNIGVNPKEIFFFKIKKSYRCSMFLLLYSRIGNTSE